MKAVQRTIQRAVCKAPDVGCGRLILQGAVHAIADKTPMIRAMLTVFRVPSCSFYEQCMLKCFPKKIPEALHLIWGVDSLLRRELYMPSQITLRSALAMRSVPSAALYSIPDTASPLPSRHSSP